MDLIKKQLYIVDGKAYRISPSEKESFFTEHKDKIILDILGRQVNIPPPPPENEEQKYILGHQRMSLDRQC